MKGKQQALRRVAHQGNIEDIRYLIEQEGVDINAQDENKGLTALHWAVKRGHQQVAAWLLAHGARADIKDGEGCIPDDYKVKRS
ncbi:ankyrin repeat domain-containing protein [Neochlamydia sp. AcF95]|uniref:ankyrin repeat domain-containing protein n=1 Tax=Neochlamydia sp. AcF95 TaxID=2795734 RepID=UPI001BC95346|nr:ankyrin repeat domain-containing protein [Neochlamydia sp. AcF95]MBS4170175.1 hypothetical protein [Neochlamydia sp. AcF95]